VVLSNNVEAYPMVLPTGQIWNIASPAIDAGLNSDASVTIPALDITGQAIVNSTKDMGAYEWVTTPSLTAYDASALSINYSTNIPFIGREVSSGTIHGVISISNTGTEPALIGLTLDQGTIGGGSEFALGQSTGTLPLAVGATYLVGIDWTPALADVNVTRDAALVVLHSGATPVSPYSVPLGGTAVPVILSVFRVE
jgi:hypothetical protein